MPVSDLAQLAVAVGVVFLVNLLPAFGPPTWAVLVFFSLDFDLPAVPLVLGGVPLLPLTAAFFAGRLVSYSIYISPANIAEESLGTIVTDALTSPLGMGLQLAMLVALAVLLGGFSPDRRLGKKMWGPPDERADRRPLR